MRDELVEAVARAMWADMLKSGQANDLRDWEARSGKDGEWEWRSPAVDDKTKARIRSAARAAIAAAEPSIRADERERAAKVAESQYRDHPASTPRAVHYRHAGRTIAAAIRGGDGRG